MKTNVFIKKNSCNCNIDSITNVITYDYDYSQFEQPFNYIKCNSCNIVYLEYLPDSSNVSSIYPSNYEAYGSKIFGFFGGVARSIAAKIKIFRILKIKKNVKFALELGCGSQPLITNFKNCDITLSDIHISNELRIYKHHEGDIENTVKIIKDKYDLIVFDQVIEHLSNPQEFLINVKNLLKDDGVIYFETPNYDGYEAKLFLHSGIWGGLHAPRHFNIYNQKSIHSLIRNAGLRDIASGSLLNPYLLNQTLRNFLIYKHKNNLATHIKMSNPFLLAVYLIFDFLSLAFGEVTGNMYIACKKTSAVL